jgi:hypothetical protein
MGGRQATIAAGTLTVGAFAIVTITSHRRQWNKASFRINGRERRFSSKLTENLRSKVSKPTPHYLYHKEKTEAVVQTPRLG